MTDWMLIEDSLAIFNNVQILSTLFSFDIFEKNVKIFKPWNTMKPSYF